MSPFKQPWRQQLRCLPWWWFLPYLSVIIVFCGVIVFLISHGVAVAVAVSVPTIVSAVTVRALARVARLARTTSRTA